MKKGLLAIGILIFVVLAGLLFFLSRGGSVNTSDAVEADWRLLGELDYISGKKSAELEAVNQKLARVPGFMVPLEDNQNAVHEFLLVPSPQACIHVPPPPPNQMVLIRMKAGTEAKVEFGPVWVYGILKIENAKHQYGESSFLMEGLKIEPYR